MSYAVIRDPDLLDEIRYYSNLALEQAASCEKPEQVIAIDPPNTRLSETFLSYSLEGGIFSRKYHILDAVSFIPPNSKIAESYLKYHREGRRLALGTEIFQSLEDLPVPAITFSTEHNLKTGERSTRYYFSVIRMGARLSYSKADILLSEEGSDFHRAVFNDPQFGSLGGKSGFYKSSLSYCIEATRLLRRFVGQEFGDKADFIYGRSKSSAPEFTAPLRKYVDYYNLVQIRELISRGNILEECVKPDVNSKRTKVWNASKSFIASSATLSNYELDVISRVSEMMNSDSARSKGFKASENLDNEKISGLVKGLGCLAVSRHLYNALNDEEVFKVVETIPYKSTDRWITHDYLIAKRDGDLYAQIQLYDKNKIEKRSRIFKFCKGEYESVIRRFLARKIFEEFVEIEIDSLSLNKMFQSHSWNNVKLEEIICQREIPHEVVSSQLRRAVV